MEPWQKALLAAWAIPVLLVVVLIGIQAYELFAHLRGRGRWLEGDGGDVCSCGHPYCYHADEDHTTEGERYQDAGCQISGCPCRRVWDGEEK